jgi:hypothetical protein
MSPSTLLCPLAFFISSLSPHSKPMDAAVESFMVEPAAIHRDALRGAIGVITITFSELDYFIEMKMPSAKIQTYSSKEGSRGGTNKLHLSLENIKVISGLDYSGLIYRRFPIVNTGTGILEIVYDVEKNLRAWIMIDDHNYVRTSVGQLLPSTILMFGDQTLNEETVDLFFLLNGKARKFYQRPDDTSPSAAVAKESDLAFIEWRKLETRIHTIFITEIQGEFAKISTRAAMDEEPEFAGWIKIRENDVLTLWPFAMGGC